MTRLNTESYDPSVFAPFVGGPLRLFIGPTHHDVLLALWYAISKPGAMSVLIGEKGTGKTTLAKALAAFRERQFHIAYVDRCPEDFDGILDVLLNEVAIAPHQLSRGSRLDALAEFSAGLDSGQRVVLILDDAQDLKDEALEELRLLTLSKAFPGPHVILVGGPELADKLRNPKYKWLEQSICSRVELHRLRSTEVYDYVRYLTYLHCVAYPDWSFGALDWIAYCSGGVPRIINVLFQGAVTLAQWEGAAVVGSRHVREAARHEEQLEPSSDEAGRHLSASEIGRLARHWVCGRGKAVSIASLTMVMAVGIGLAMSIATERVHGNSAPAHRVVPGLASKASFGHPAGQMEKHLPIASGITQAPDFFTSAPQPELGRQALALFDENGLAPGLCTGVPVKTVPALGKSDPTQPSEAPAKADSSPPAAVSLKDPKGSNSGGAAAELTDPIAQSPGKVLKPAPEVDLVGEPLQQGDAAMVDGRYEAAILKYKTALSLDPGSGMIREKIRRAHSAQTAEKAVLQ